ncbi:hypothetical protein RJ639_029229 [Escallonia herrerae]|uniref:Reverse transcriptase RNase H-like domain-containing protein n=1 Tax=Escallonia herrerae TaxID=1293975 RepID=A0AA88XBZ3_9ASTE|nr:hypothetical protein RJ639_029229 [Escallonia herrerae]
MGEVKNRLGFFKKNLQTLEDHVLEELESLKKAVTTQDELCTRFMLLFAIGVEETRQETAMCKKAIAGGVVVTPSPRVDAPKPKEFRGKRDEKELDNFIWHMERYFEGASVADEKAMGYLAKATPLTDLLKKGKTWEWSKRCQTAFKGLKEAVTEEPVLATNASNFAIGGVLMQEGHPIMVESCKLNDIERKYTVQDKEMTAVVHCLYTWRHYLLGSRFLIKTDNITTRYFQSQKKLSPKQQPLTPLALAGDYKGRSHLAMQVARLWNEQANVARSYLDKAARKMKKWANKRRRPKEYNLGDMVMLCPTSNGREVRFRSVGPNDDRNIPRKEFGLNSYSMIKRGIAIGSSKLGLMLEIKLMFVIKIY